MKRKVLALVAHSKKSLGISNRSFKENSVSYTFVNNTTKQVSKSYKDAYDAYTYQNREGNKLCLIQNKKVIMILNTKMISVKWAIACASRVLHLFEKKYPDDLRPRQALEAATRWLNSPTETNRMAANAAAHAACAAANAAADNGDRVAYSVAYAAYAAARAAWAAANAGAEAWWAADWAAEAAEYADDARSKEIAWQRRCLQSIVDRSIAILYLLKMQQNPKTTLPPDLQKLVMNFM